MRVFPLLMSIKWMHDVCFSALLTGARRTEILSMTWDKIDFQNKIAIISSDIAKNEKTRLLMLNDEALKMVQQYAHLNAEHLSQFSNAVTIWSQNENKDNQHLGWWS